MTVYLIPSRALAGRVRVLLRTYKKYTVGNVSGLLGVGRWSGSATDPSGRVRGIARSTLTGFADHRGRGGHQLTDVAVWLEEVCAALGVPADEVLPDALREQMLGLTGDIAHSVMRLAVPLTSYLMGVAVGRGASPQEALRIVAGLLAKGDE